MVAVEFTPMHESIGGRPSTEPPVLTDPCMGENMVHVADVTSDGCSLSPSDVSTTFSQVCVEEQEDAQPGTSNTTQEDNVCPPLPTKKRASLLGFFAGGSRERGGKLPCLTRKHKVLLSENNLNVSNGQFTLFLTQ